MDSRRLIAEQKSHHSVDDELVCLLGFVCLLQHSVLTHCREQIHSTTVSNTKTEVKNRRNTAVPLSALRMNLWLLLTFSALAQCAHSCPDLCSCFFSPSGAEVECSLSSLPHDGLPSNTTRLSIQSTNLSSISAADLRAVPLLTNLQLYHNNLSSLPADLLQDVPLLNKLDLTGNQLVSLPANIFSHESLRSLVLKNNRIEKADAEWFSGNSSVTWIDLSGNRLTSVASALLQKLPNLENLDLSDNNLQDLQADALQSLHHLEILNLAGNNLISLNPTIFSHNLKLSQLFLQENRLRELPATLLQGLQHLELLLLNQNQLQHLPPGLLDQIKPSFRMILARNPWVCDEKIVYLWRWLTAHRDNIIFLEAVACSAPEALKHRQVASLCDSELGLGLTTAIAEAW
ncbi:leucine-rich alpha-2-glycoprotein-like [Centropristis striata]|uniref:leucine-rich alpha-2-glycoprotein-like n=1 Tax=Centropristis striata TaxID=184440 RepID=UPI0027DF1EB6|nr:leucine-rich alpha-2-glycoprotein-like [Centropristis striata]